MKGSGHAASGRNRAESGSARRSRARSARADACFTSTRLEPTPISRLERNPERSSPGHSGSPSVGAEPQVVGERGDGQLELTLDLVGLGHHPPQPRLRVAGGRSRSSAGAGPRGGGTPPNSSRWAWSRRTRALASSGRAAPLPYPATRYSARTLEPSGATHRKALRSMAEGTPRHTTACSNPADARIWGIWPTWPNMSGRYPTSMAPPKAVARRIPAWRLRMMVSPDTRNSSIRMYQGPTVIRPAPVSAASRPSFSGRISR